MLAYNGSLGLPEHLRYVESMVAPAIGRNVNAMIERYPQATSLVDVSLEYSPITLAGNRIHTTMNRAATTTAKRRFT